MMKKDKPSKLYMVLNDTKGCHSDIMTIILINFLYRLPDDVLPVDVPLRCPFHERLGRLVLFHRRGAGHGLWPRRSLFDPFQRNRVVGFKLFLLFLLN